MHELTNFAIKNGWKVNKNTMIDFKTPINQQREDLIEDMFQTDIVLNDYGIVIMDAGWYGEYLTDCGTFILYLIKDFDWENPLLKFETESVFELYVAMKILLELTPRLNP